MRGLKRHVTCISLLLLSFIGCSPQTPPEPVERPVQRFIDPSVHLPEWDWTRKEKIRVLNPEGSGQEYPPNLVQLDKLWRKAFVLNPGQTFSESLNTGGSGTFEFSSMGARKAGMEGDYRMFLDVAVASAGNRIERRYEVPVTESTSIKWLDMSIPVPRMTDPVTWTISVTCDPAPESMGTIHAFIATPVFVPDTVEKKPHVILLAYDSMRADALGAYGSPHAMTPTMDMLSRKGILFSQSLSSSSWTLPGVQNMLAGHYLHRFLCEAQPFHLAQDFEIPLIPAEFATAGYFTIGISANHLVSPEHGLDMGFDIFDTKASEKWMTWSTIPLYYRITELLSKYGDRPLFIYIHAMDPHDPYTPLEPFDAICSPPDNADIRPRIRQRDSGYLNLHPFKDTLLPLTEAENEFLRANYRGEVRQMDTFLLSFLEYLEELSMCDDLILAITADHGEEFGEHSSYQHGISLYEPVVRVPLILMDFVNDRSPEVVPARVSTIDVASTLLHMADVSTRATFEGINLLSPEAMADPDRLIYTIVRNHDEPEIPRWRLRSVYQNERKLTWQSRDVLTAYDLLRGPDESVFREFENWDAFFAADIDARWRGMGEQLKIFMDSLAERRQSGGMDKMLTQKLRDLGYIE